MGQAMGRQDKNTEPKCPECPLLVGQNSQWKGQDSRSVSTIPVCTSGALPQDVVSVTENPLEDPVTFKEGYAQPLTKCKLKKIIPTQKKTKGNLIRPGAENHSWFSANTKARLHLFMRNNLGAANPGRWGRTTNSHTMKAGSRLPSEVQCQPEKMELAESLGCLGLAVQG